MKIAGDQLSSRCAIWQMAWWCDGKEPSVSSSGVTPVVSRARGAGTTCSSRRQRTSNRSNSFSSRSVLITDAGGVMMGDSIDQGEPGQTNDLALLDDSHFAEVLAEANRIIQGERQQRKSFRKLG
jgi:hypothetical protein